MEGLLTALIVFAVLGGVTCALACVGSAVHIVVTVLNMLGLLPKGLVDSTVGRSYDKLMYCRGNKLCVLPLARSPRTHVLTRTLLPLTQLWDLLVLERRRSRLRAAFLLL
jgi:hypothetical protein